MKCKRYSLVVLGVMLTWLVLALSLVPAAFAQITTAAIRGTIMDEQGLAIAGADVTFTGSDNGFTRSMKSGSEGQYNFPDLPLGVYRVLVTKTGFKAETQTGIVLHVNDSLVLNIGLAVGAITDSVTVEASPIAVETTSGELTGLIQGDQVTELPLNGRNFMQLITLVPDLVTRLTVAPDIPPVSAPLLLRAILNSWMDSVDG